MNEYEKIYHNHMKHMLTEWLFASGYSETEVDEIIKDEDLLETYEKTYEYAENEKERIINYTIGTYLRGRTEEKPLWSKYHS